MARVPPKQILVIDASLLAKNMYRLLFAAVGPYEITYAEQLGALPPVMPDLVIVNSNALPKDESFLGLQRNGPMIILTAPDRTDLKELAVTRSDLIIIQKPFFPYDLLSEVNRILGTPRKAAPLESKKGKRKK